MARRSRIVQHDGIAYGAFLFAKVAIGMMLQFGSIRLFMFVLFAILSLAIQQYPTFCLNLT